MPFSFILAISIHCYSINQLLFSQSTYVLYHIVFVGGYAVVGAAAMTAGATGLII